MTVRQEENAITLTGICGVEEVEVLIGLLDAKPKPCIDLGAAVSIHTALWQALMVFRPEIIGLSAPSLADDQVAQGLKTFFVRTPDYSA
jgi:hypothetical protein